MHTYSTLGLTERDSDKHQGTHTHTHMHALINLDRGEGIKSTTCSWAFGRLHHGSFPEAVGRLYLQAGILVPVNPALGCQLPASWHSGLHLCVALGRAEDEIMVRSYLNDRCVGESSLFPMAQTHRKKVSTLNFQYRSRTQFRVQLNFGFFGGVQFLTNLRTLTKLNYAHVEVMTPPAFRGKFTNAVIQFKLYAQFEMLICLTVVRTLNNTQHHCC